MVQPVPPYGAGGLLEPGFSRLTGKTLEPPTFHDLSVSPENDVNDCTEEERYSKQDGKGPLADAVRKTAVNMMPLSSHLCPTIEAMGIDRSSDIRISNATRRTGSAYFHLSPLAVVFVVLDISNVDTHTLVLFFNLGDVLTLVLERKSDVVREPDT